jgi:hypothetical protein
MSFQIAVPFAPLGLSPDVYTGVAILSTEGIVKVGVAKVPFTRQLSDPYINSSLEFVINAALTTVLGVVTNGGIGQAVSATVTWLASPTDAFSADGVADPVVIGDFGPYQSQPLLPYVMVGMVALVQGARTLGDPIPRGTIIGLRDDGTTFICDVTGESEEFYSGENLRQLVSGEWAVIYSINGAPNLVSGPFPEGQATITTTQTGTVLSDPGDPRFYGEIEYGIKSAGAALIPLGINAYRNSDGTFLTYGEVFDEGLWQLLPFTATWSKTGSTWSSVTKDTFTNSAQRIIIDGGIHIDPSPPMPWGSIPVLTEPSAPVITVTYFWGAMEKAYETPVISVG